ncbi:MAG: alpha/beta fold hydrolase [Candidatus Sericytochromatia bacterium]
MEKTIETPFDLNGCSTPVTLSGEGIAVVLLHGGPGSFDYLEGLVDLLPPGMMAIRYDQRGGGRAGHDGPFTIAQLIDDLEALRRQLDLEGWIVAGHSWGAFLALAYAARYPEHTHMLLQISGSGLDPDWQKTYHTNRRKRLPPAEQIEFLHLRQERENVCEGKQAGVERRLLEINLKADFHDPAKIANLPDLLAHPPNREAAEALLADWNQSLLDPAFRQAVAGLAMPVLCLHGTADPRPATGEQTLGEVLPQGRFVALADAGHYPWIEQPQAVRQALASFLLPLFHELGWA